MRSDPLTIAYVVDAMDVETARSSHNVQLDQANKSYSVSLEGGLKERAQSSS